jgi:Sec-independent protein secretion pathway component TatC
MAEAEETFMSHLIELRSRVMKASIAIIIAFLCLMPWAAQMCDYTVFNPSQSHDAGGLYHRFALGVVSSMGLYCAGFISP